MLLNSEILLLIELPRSDSTAMISDNNIVGFYLNYHLKENMTMKIVVTINKYGDNPTTGNIWVPKVFSAISDLSWKYLQRTFLQ